MILSDRDILSRCIDTETLETKEDSILKPFVTHKVRQKLVSENEYEPVISYGLSSGGYDIRLGTNFREFKGDIVDPKNIDEMEWINVTHEEPFIMQPFQSLLGESVEIFNMPDDVIGVALGKSTYARTGLFLNVTPLEPSWKGVLTLELNNLTSNPIKVYPNEGILQILFFRFETPVINAYEGKYQNQVGVTTSKVGK